MKKASSERKKLENPMVPHLSDLSAGFGTLPLFGLEIPKFRRLPGFTGPGPSAALDEHIHISLII
jgi:hypothetical protein